MSDLMIRPMRSSSAAPSEKTQTPDPYLGLRFWIELGQVRIAGFSECSGLSIETEVFEYQEGGENTYTHKLPVRTKYSNITLKRGMDDSQELYRWYLSTLNGNTRRRNISILLFDSQQNVVKKWDLMGAYPVNWTGPDMKADAGAIAVETVEIAHNGLTPESSREEMRAVTQQRSLAAVQSRS